MATGKKVLIIGPCFIGWNVLDLLIQEDYDATGFVRRKEHADGIKAFGASSVVIGDLDDKETITDQTVQHDIIIHTATADHLPNVQAVLEVIKIRAGKDQMTIFIHTSGTSVLDDDAKGAFKTERIYHDDERSEIDSVLDDAPHRQIDLAIVAAQKELHEKAKLAIMIPLLIYGRTHDRGTIQIPILTRSAFKNGYAPVVGKGLSVESNIHVLDLARAYVVLLHHLETTPASSTLANPYYFCECTGDNEPSWFEIASLIGDSLHKARKIQDPKPKEVSKELYEDLFSTYTDPVVGLNSRSRAVRLRDLGWEPREKDWRKSYVEAEIPEVLKEETGDFAGYNGVAAS